jgi:undecaprenyl-diphosphatase
MTWWQGFVLGLVQGVTEFLPISSSGHLVVAETAIGLSTPGVVVEVALHVATLLAVVIVYWWRLWELVQGVLRNQRDAWRYVGLLAIATVPAGVVGILFADFFERVFDSLLTVGVDFVVTGFILWSTRAVALRASRPEPGVGSAVVIGFAQALAILPGISRSGTTVAAGLWRHVDPVRAAEFSFLMAIPTIAGAAVLQIPDLTGGIAAIGTGPLLLSFVTALIAGVFAIRLLVAVLRRRAFHRFAPYCWSIGLVTIAWALVR